MTTMTAVQVIAAKNQAMTQTVKTLTETLALGVLGNPIKFRVVETILGPRSGTLVLELLMRQGDVYRFLRADDFAATRQFIRWDFPGDPEVYQNGKYLYIEANWPVEWPFNYVDLQDINSRPRTNGRWALAQDARGVLRNGGFSTDTPHYLICGTTGSGKTVALLNAAVQLSAPQQNCQLILIDGKYGASLGILEGLPNIVGPLAVDEATIIAALAWVYQEMVRRYELMRYGGPKAIAQLPRLIVIFDEFQEYINEPHIHFYFSQIAAKGRAANVSLLAGTQHPALDIFKNDKTIRRNLVGRLAFRVTDFDASRVVIGAASPRAERLAGRGDMYLREPTGAFIRAQGVFVSEEYIQAKKGRGHPTILAEWPEVVLETNEHEPTVNYAYSGAELAHGLVAALSNWGRNRLVKAMAAAGLGKPGGARGPRLLTIGRELRTALEDMGYILVRAAENVDTASDLPACPEDVDGALVAENGHGNGHTE